METPGIDWRMSALVRAISQRDSGAVRAALAAGDDPNMECDEITPLHMATSLGPVESVKILLEAGANTEATDDLGSTPLHYAAMSNLADTAAVAKALIDAGSVVSAVDHRARTPLDYAAGFKHEAFARVLIGAGATCRREYKNWCERIVDKDPPASGKDMTR